MIRRALIIAVFALLPFSALAQDTITYKGHDIELEPERGGVQCLVWERNEVRHEDPDGVEITATVIGVIFVDDMTNGWIVAGHLERAAEGVWNLNVGDDCGTAMVIV